MQAASQPQRMADKRSLRTSGAGGVSGLRSATVNDRASSAAGPKHRCWLPRNRISPQSNERRGASPKRPSPVGDPLLANAVQNASAARSAPPGASVSSIRRRRFDGSCAAGGWVTPQRPKPGRRSRWLLQQLEDCLLLRVGLGQSRDAGLAQDLVLGHVGAGLRVVGGLDCVLRRLHVFLLRAEHLAD